MLAFEPVAKLPLDAITTDRIGVYAAKRQQDGLEISSVNRELQVLRRIFEEVCPHSTDDTLDGSEDSGNDGCMSCDTRDLAHCALTRRSWYGIAAGLL